MWRFLRGISLSWWIVIATVLGAVVGYLDHDVWVNTNVGAALNPLSTIFLRMIKSIVVPLVFGALVIGIAGHGDDLKRVGRLALKSLIYFEIVTSIALFIGLGAVNLFKPGVGVTLSGSAADAEKLAGTPTTLAGVLEHTVPQSFFEAASRNEVLQIVFFAVLFAAALTQVKGKPKEAMLGFCEGLAEVMFKFTGIVMKFAPIGIGAAIANTIGTERHRRHLEPGQAGADALPGADRVHPRGAGAGGAAGADSAPRFLEAGQGAVRCSRSPPRHRRRRCRWRWRTWRASACRGGSSPS